VSEAARIFATARRSGIRIGALPETARPAGLAEAHAIQDATSAALGDPVAGWKVAITPAGEVMRGAILASRMLASPAALRASLVPMLGIEAEIAFRFDRDLPPREADYSEAEIAGAATALAAIEVVDSRFESYKDTPLLDRTADCMSNGALVSGTARADWRTIDLAGLEATLTVNGAVVVQKRGGHATGDPIRPAVPLVNALRRSGGVRAGQVITTGTYTGLVFVQPGDHVVAEFAGFGSAEIRFE
jgi:2-keto-4-pentenoate hydratase